MTSVKQIPVLVTPRHFSKCDKEVAEKVKIYTDTNFNKEVEITE